MIIAITGASGSGKTTIINHLKKWEFLKKRGVIVKKEDNFLILNFLKFIFGNNVFNEYKEQKFFNKQQSTLKSKLFSRVVGLFYPLIIYLEFLSAHILYSTIWKKQILLSDRYIYDYLVTFEEMLGIHNPIIRLLITHFPKPDLIFYLSIDKKTSLLRNKNNIKGKITSLKSLHENIIKKYNNLTNQFSILTIDNNDNINNTVKEIKYYIYAKEKLVNIKSLSISGIDGSGKTTTCNNLGNLCKKLDISFHIVHFYHMSILYKLCNILGLVFNNKISVNQVPKNKSFFWALFTFIDSYIQYYYSKVLNFNSLIIYDRYLYDYLVSFRYKNVPGQKLFVNFIPRPNRSLIFMLKPEEAYKRNTDNLSKDYFQNTHIFYNKLASEQKLQIIQVGSKNPQNIVKEVIKSV